jgi:hypothetical protein
MKQWVNDFVLLGVGLWLLGYLASLLLFFSPFQSSMGWIITAVFTPFTIAVAWWWFRTRELPLSYYVKVGIAWTAIAVLLDYLCIVRLFQTPYYEMDVVVYYALTFLIPVVVGIFITRSSGGSRAE